MNELVKHLIDFFLVGISRSDLNSCVDVSVVLSRTIHLEGFVP